MFSHIMIGANDLAASRTFYDAVLGALGVPAGVMDEKGRVFYLSPSGVFAITNPINGAPATAANGGTVRDRPWRHDLRGPAGRARGESRQDVPRVPPGSVRQQDLRAAPHGLSPRRHRG
jgi:catechol 2,3-dioxygenase-like lactoylglutathione lyase family enzyme